MTLSISFVQGYHVETSFRPTSAFYIQANSSMNAWAKENIMQFAFCEPFLDGALGNVSSGLTNNTASGIDTNRMLGRVYWIGLTRAEFQGWYYLALLRPWLQSQNLIEYRLDPVAMIARTAHLGIAPSDTHSRRNSISEERTTFQ